MQEARESDRHLRSLEEQVELKREGWHRDAPIHVSVELKDLASAYVLAHVHVVRGCDQGEEDPAACVSDCEHHLRVGDGCAEDQGS